MGEIELKSLPKDMSAMAVNPGHLGRVPIDGCFKQQVKVQGESGERAADHVYSRGQRQSGLRTGENAGGSVHHLSGI